MAAALPATCSGAHCTAALEPGDDVSALECNQCVHRNMADLLRHDVAARIKMGGGGKYRFAAGNDKEVYSCRRVN
jgi:hypothetical protein